VLGHAAHGLVYSVWIAAAAFAAVDRDLELAARNMGRSGLRTFATITLPLAAPRHHGERDLRVPRVARRVHRHLLRWRAAGHDAAAPALLGLDGGNYQIASITALILLVPSVAFMMVIERFLRADVLSKVGQ
jgi:ABC-type Fe3+ transport system permease subunit